MRLFSIFTALSVLASVTGCSSIYSGYGVSAIKADQISTAQRLQAALTKIDDKDNNPNHIISASCFNIPVAAADAAKCQQQRNAAVVMLLNASDDMCQEHMKTIFGNDAAFNITTGTITSLAAGWATFTNGLAAKTTLSAIAAFSNAERSLVNETVYKNLLVTAVTTKIREARTTKSAAIVPANFKQSIDDYPMLVATRDVINYHYTCSFMFGLEKALNEGTQPTLESRKPKLEQEKQMLDLYIDSRPVGADQTGVTGAKARIKAIDEELAAISRAQK
jgi:hypothetical protein